MNFNKLSKNEAQMIAAMATLSLPMEDIRRIQDSNLDATDSVDASSQISSHFLSRLVGSTRGLIAALLVATGLGLSTVDSANAAPPTPQEIALLKQNPFGVLLNLRKNFYAMHRLSFEGKLSDQQIKDLFRDLNAWLHELEKILPDHKAVQTTRSMLQELEADYANNGKENLRLDTSFEKMMQILQKDFVKWRVRRVKIHQASKQAQELAGKMKLAGVPVSYIVKNKENPRGVIVFFPQIHYGMNLSPEINQEFTKTYEEKLFSQLRKLIEGGVISDLFFEGFEGEITDEIALKMKQAVSRNPDLPVSPGEKLAMQYGSKVRFVGVDNIDLLHYVLELSNRMVRQMKLDDELIEAGKLTVQEFEEMNRRFRKILEELQKGLEFRATVHNSVFVLNADIQMQFLAQMLHRNVAAFIFGASHEVNFKDGNRILKDGEPHPLPLSSLLASAGFEVLVVEQITPEDAERLFSTVMNKVSGPKNQLRSTDWIKERMEKIRRGIEKK